MLRFTSSLAAPYSTYSIIYLFTFSQVMKKKIIYINRLLHKVSALKMHRAHNILERKPLNMSFPATVKLLKVSGTTYCLIFYLFQLLYFFGGVRFLGFGGFVFWGFFGGVWVGVFLWFFFFFFF